MAISQVFDVPAAASAAAPMAPRVQPAKCRSHPWGIAYLYIRGRRFPIYKCDTCGKEVIPE